MFLCQPGKHGIFWSAYFMYGLPTETREDMLKTLEFMKEVNPPYAGLGLYAPMPNTTLWDQGLELGLINSDIHINHFLKQIQRTIFSRITEDELLAWSMKNL